jgi:hypothetical protein
VKTKWLCPVNVLLSQVPVAGCYEHSNEPSPVSPVIQTFLLPDVLVPDLILPLAFHESPFVSECWAGSELADFLWAALAVLHFRTYWQHTLLWAHTFLLCEAQAHPIHVFTFPTFCQYCLCWLSFSVCLFVMQSVHKNIILCSQPQLSSVKPVSPFKAWNLCTGYIIIQFVPHRKHAAGIVYCHDEGGDVSLVNVGLCLN